MTHNRPEYQVAIVCEHPHKRYNRTIPYNWKPSRSEIFDSIRRLRGQAASDGVDSIVSIKRVYIRKIETIADIDVDGVGFQATTDDIEPQL